jgi:cytosine/adenosine deaminase-related metal-dependent hydrolase
MLTDREFDLIAETQGTVTVTPSTDMLMQFGTFPATGPALATLDGARVWDLEDEIGTLTPGKQADIAVIDMRSPHLDGFGDPVAVMVLGAGPADVETVIVGGDVVKRDGKLVGDNAGHALELMHAAREHLRA